MKKVILATAIASVFSANVMAETGIDPIFPVEPVDPPVTTPVGERLIEGFNDKAAEAGYEIVVTTNGNGDTILQMHKDGANLGNIAMKQAGKDKWMQNPAQKENAEILKSEAIKAAAAKRKGDDVVQPPRQPVFENPQPEKPKRDGQLKEAYADLYNAGKNLTSVGQAAAVSLEALEADVNFLYNEVDRLDTRIDQTQALNAATVNARPMVTNGQTAFGAGVGYAGSEAAVAVGVAHSFEGTGWSVSSTLSATQDDFVVGAGTQWAF